MQKAGRTYNLTENKSFFNFFLDNSYSTGYIINITTEETMNIGDLVQIQQTLPSSETSIDNGIIGIVTEVATAGSRQYVQLVDGNGQSYCLSSSQLKKI
tara:strand:- start:953 stop:1249 length:297 start_codon:yes stop_codon:yes gene_type:complete